MSKAGRIVEAGEVRVARYPSLTLVITLVAAIGLAYGGVFGVPLLFDDELTIVENPSIRSLWNIGDALSPPASSGTGGRPLANLSFAVSYAISGLDPWAHHAFNLLFHFLAALTLYGVVRRTLEKPRLRARFGAESVALAGAIATLWAVHPLQTQTVTYISQRTEGLMSLCYLLVLYCFIRGVEGRAQVWHPLAVAACLAGVLCKEVAVTAPLMVLVYDRTFISGTFQAAWRARWRLYFGLAASWAVLVPLVRDVGERGVGFHLGAPWWHYALTQCEAVVRYLKLAWWPDPLVFDYSPGLVASLGAVWPSMIFLAALLGAATWGVIRRSLWAFPAVWYLIVLAPTSIVPVTGAPIAENRAYLPIAAIVTVLVLGGRLLLGPRFSRLGWGILTVAAIAATVNRNRDYQDAVGLWTDTVAKAPDNHRAHGFLAKHLAAFPDRTADTLSHYATALRLQPDYDEAHNNLGTLLARLPGRQADAIMHYETALRLRPDFAKAHYNLANLLVTMPGRQPDAQRHYEVAVRLRPDFAEAHHNLAELLALQPGKVADALNHYETALRLSPSHPAIHYNLARLLTRLPGRQADAIARYEAAVRLSPAFAEAHDNLAQLFADQPGRMEQAIAHYEQALLSRPGHAGTHNNLANLLARLPGRHDEAIAHYLHALKLRPDFAEAHYNLSVVLARFPHRAEEAKLHHEAARRLLSNRGAAPADPTGKREDSPSARTPNP
jgi:tetratricopeptide (TPR) repeat protein